MCRCVCAVYAASFESLDVVAFGILVHWYIVQYLSQVHVIVGLNTRIARRKSAIPQ